MEHRWGERVVLHLTVELSCGSLALIAGALENVSASGAFVRTAGRGPPRGPVEVMLHGRGSRCAHVARLSAYVVRETDTGVGIEWSEFAPRAVRELIFRDGRASVVPARTGRPSARRSSHIPNTTRPPLAPPPAEPGASGASTA